MISVGYFCTGGYTEIGSIQGFLERINKNIKFVRCFPIANKVCLKRGRMASTPVRSQNGITGDNLVNEMKQKLIHLDSKLFDLFLLIDDMDCRFKKDGAPSFDEWVRDLKQQISAIIGTEVSFEALLASPEIEAWFLADWNNTFASEYRYIKDHLRYLISKSDIDEFIDNIEEYGGTYLNGSCSIKLSNRIQEILLSESTPRNQYLYSKRIHGVGMLARLAPENVAERCRLYFAPVYRRLLELR